MSQWIEADNLIETAIFDQAAVTQSVKNIFNPVKTR